MVFCIAWQWDVGASGSGKSSLVRAGLAVALKRAGWQVRVLTPTATPMRMLEANLNSNHASSAEGVLILVDQFEEVFTLCHDELERTSFIEKLIDSTEGHVNNTTVMIALRADFYWPALNINDCERQLQPNKSIGFGEIFYRNPLSVKGDIILFSELRLHTRVLQSQCQFSILE